MRLLFKMKVLPFFYVMGGERAPFASVQGLLKQYSCPKRPMMRSLEVFAKPNAARDIAGNIGTKFISVVVKPRNFSSSLSQLLNYG